MRTVALIGAVALILIVLWDVFETIVLPRRVRGPLHLTWLLYRVTWAPWSALGRKIHMHDRRETFLSLYGQLALLFLLFVWARGLIAGFATIQWALGSQVTSPYGHRGFWTDLYMSGTTFFTLGLGDVVPKAGIARAVTVIEAGVGFGVLALVIGYLPVLYQAFSRREVAISLLDARAGSPPSAGTLFTRLPPDSRKAELEALLREWELWCAQLLESQLSYPPLAY